MSKLDKFGKGLPLLLTSSLLQVAAKLYAIKLLVSVDYIDGVSKYVSYYLFDFTMFKDPSKTKRTDVQTYWSKFMFFFQI